MVKHFDDSQQRIRFRRAIRLSVELNVDLHFRRRAPTQRGSFYLFGIFYSIIMVVSQLYCYLFFIAGCFMFFYFFPVGLWITARFSGVQVGLFELVFMRIRKVPPGIIVDGLIVATKAGLKLTLMEVETHYLAGGHVPSVIKALISADKANISLSFKQATAIDLAGRDIPRL